ncbi:Alpha-1,6-mannosyl-glycoprotein 2-beta-N-acetylglucosaminyltransferase [Basidiobolus ranarum]|uniref:Alpha-1,6-mannosyl-glycoprotein 2-beta-N-acetylglucosaminyltransferase n=1 Tax=Basidiobolus ranarum TaxID=34480 RepID=A0ABR2VZZ1_9FUNG
MLFQIQLRCRFRTGYFLQILAMLFLCFWLAFVVSVITYANYSHRVSTEATSDLLLTSKKKQWPQGGVQFLPLLVPVSDNAEYLKQLIAALLKMENLNKTIVVFSQEGNNKEVESIIEKIPSEMEILYLHHVRPFFSISSLFETKWFPSAGNVEFLLSFAFDSMKAPGAIVLQSDLLPSSDMYNYFEWAFETILQNPNFSNVLNINGFNKDPYTMKDIYYLTPDRFKPRGWCVSAEKWPLLQGQWTKAGNWGYNIENNVRIPHHMVSLTPMVARVRSVRNMFNEIPNFSDIHDYGSTDVHDKTKHISYKRKKPSIVMSHYSKLAVQGFRYPARNIKVNFSRKFGIFRHEH